MNRGTIKRKDVKLLWGLSGDRCANCRTELILQEKGGENFPLGIMAHIEGENPGSARYNPEMNDLDRIKYENLILLCPNCHTTVDNDTEQYTMDQLKSMKKKHEEWVRQTLRSQTAQTTFAELEVTITHLQQIPALGDDLSITIVPPKEKIRRNELSAEVENLIISGMLQVKLVKDYLSRNPDLSFARRLQAGFVRKYEDLKKEGLEGDALFYALLGFASNNSPDFGRMSAGLSVLTYFFELCEVFEK